MPQTRPPLTTEQNTVISRKLLKLFLREELGLMSSDQFNETVQKAADKTGIDADQIRELTKDLIGELVNEMLGNGHGPTA